MPGLTKIAAETGVSKKGSGEMAQDQECAVLFAELIGAADLYERAGDTAAHESIAECFERLGRAAASCKAKVIKRTGARLMLLAPSADDAAGAAIAMQQAACEFPAALSSLALGVGFHYGPVIEDNSDVFGDAVNLAARLVEQAARGQILFAADTSDVLSTRSRRSLRRLYALPVKGRSMEVALCELVWRADQAPTMFPARGVEPLHAKLKLKYRGRKVMLRDSHAAFTIGRDTDCALVVPDNEVSRHHCTIQRRSDHFVLADQSTNGTFVTVEGEGEVALKHEALTLRKRGWISLGGPKGSASEALEFSCD
jgi:class 3 adenylate cyclase